MEGKLVMRHAAMYFDTTPDSNELVSSSEQNYEDFCAGVMMYTRLFGLTDWSIHFHWEETDDTSAYVNYSFPARGASFVFGKHIPQSYADNPDMMMRLALHETLHLLFAEFDYINNADNLTPTQKKDLLNNAEHGVVRRLENVMMGLSAPKSDDYLLHRVRSEKSVVGEAYTLY